MARSGPRLAVAVALLAAATMPTVARGSESRCPTGAQKCVEVNADHPERELVPAGVAAVAGEIIGWVFPGSQHLHRLQAWRCLPDSCSSTESFDSGPKGLVPGDAFRFVFEGGTVLYRCTIHSDLVTDQVTGAQSCVGACGEITADPPAPGPPPSFSYPLYDPAHPLTEPFGITLVGRAPGAKAVRIKERLDDGSLSDVGVAEVSGAGDWSFTFNRALQNGTHTMWGWSIDARGFEAGPSETRFVVEGPDNTAPRVTIDEPSPGIVADRIMRIRGVAEDNVGVTSVSVELVNELDGSVIEASQVTLQPGSGERRVSFAATVTPKNTGSYTIKVFASDEAANVSLPARQEHVLFVQR